MLYLRARRGEEAFYAELADGPLNAAGRRMRGLYTARHDPPRKLLPPSGDEDRGGGAERHYAAELKEAGQQPLFIKPLRR